MDEVHDLPAIHNYWVQQFVLPLFAEVGSTGIDELWERQIAEQCRRCSPRRARLVSLGAGNGEYELPLAARLADGGLTNLELVLLELNPAMLDRALEVAEQLGLSDRVRVQETDLNTWSADEPADVYLAVHSLHHVVELEHLYDEVARSIDPQGVLLVNDMIGRNGHVRWPEASEIVRQIWAILPPRLRYNHSLGQTDDEYPDLDCSGASFEGIRAEEVLPLLLERFHPEVYVTFGNVTDPFVDRVYGPNFDPQNPDDTFVIDAVARLDEAGIDLGILTPTHLVGSFRPQPVPCRYPRTWSPEATVHARQGPALVETTPSVNGAPPSVSVEPPSVPGTPSDGVEGLEARLHAEAAKYAALRSRKAVRAALAIAESRHVARRFVHDLRSR
jgi:SAM-dependent methyltransferase